MHLNILDLSSQIKTGWVDQEPKSVVYKKYILALKIATALEKNE